MKKTLFAAVAAFAFAGGSALAADLPAKAPTYKAPPPVYYNWTGFYIGGNAGYSWGHSPTTETLTDLIFGGTNTQSETLKPKGGLGGIQAGFNWQSPSSIWVLGVEADIQATGQR